MDSKEWNSQVGRDSSKLKTLLRSAGLSLALAQASWSSLTKAEKAKIEKAAKGSKGWREEKTPVVTEKGIEKKAPIHRQVAIESALKDTLREPMTEQIKEIPIEQQIKAYGKWIRDHTSGMGGVRQMYDPTKYEEVIKTLRGFMSTFYKLDPKEDMVYNGIGNKTGQAKFSNDDMVVCLFDTAANGWDLSEAFKEWAPVQTRAEWVAESLGRKAQSRKEPWEMTQAEWDSEFEKVRPNAQGTGGGNVYTGIGKSEKGAGKIFVSLMDRVEFLKMGLKDIPLVEGEPELGVRPARHYDVIKKALSEGKSVPANVLADYPELQEKRTTQTEPWQMTRDEWEAAILATQSNYADQGVTRKDKSQAIAKFEKGEWLRYGVHKAESELLRQAMKEEITMTPEKAQELLDIINERVRHKDVIKKAISEGKQIPMNVLADYPDLAAKPRLSLENGLEGLSGDKIGYKGSSMMKTIGEARSKSRNIAEKEAEIIVHDKVLFEKNKHLSIEELQKQNQEMKDHADESTTSYPRQIKVNEELIRQKQQIEAPTSTTFTPNPKLVNERLALDSHRNISFDPEKRAKEAIDGFASHMQRVYDYLSKHATTDAQKAYLNTAMERYQTGYAEKTNAHLAAQGQCYSVLITGGSNFNNARHEKKNSAEHKKYEDKMLWDERAQNAIIHNLRKMTVEDAGGETELMKQQLTQAKAAQELMKKANAIHRKKIPDDQKLKEIMELGMSEADARKVFFTKNDPFAGRFQGFQLSNNNANIKRMEERVKEMEKKEATPTSDIMFEGGKIKDNAEADRIQILFDSIPSDELRGKFKAEGWRWSPFNKAWQRKRTDMALVSARRILGLQQEAPKFFTRKE